MFVIYDLSCIIYEYDLYMSCIQILYCVCNVEFVKVIAHVVVLHLLSILRARICILD